MKSTIGLYLALLSLSLALLVDGNKKGKKERKSAPKWKESSLPDLNKRFESIYEGKNLELDCKAQGHPKPTVTWLKDGVELTSSTKMEVKKFNLILTSVTTDMSGNYTCVVSNKHGQIEWTFHLDVQVKMWPLIIEGPNNITQTVGSNVAFRCRVLNDPKATIRWRKIQTDENAPQSDFLPDGDDPQILTLDDIKEEDEGEYRCMAGNVWGLKYSSAWLTVIRPVLVPDLPRPSDVDKNNKNNMVTNNNSNHNNNIHSNNVKTREPEPSGRFDDYNLKDLDEEDSLYDEGNSRDVMDKTDYDDDHYFTTTRRPKNTNNNRRKNGKKKDKKGKEKKRVEEDVSTTPSIMTPRTAPVTTFNNLITTTSLIWNFDENKYNLEEGSDGSTYDSPKEETSEGSFKGSISSWTIYTIVGAIGGLILLIGLVAITLTLCCQKEENSAYKSTSV